MRRRFSRGGRQTSEGVTEGDYEAIQEEKEEEKKDEEEEKKVG